MEAILETTNVSKKFGGLQVLDRVNLTVYAGEILGLVGPNGAGKTTLFNILSGAIPLDSGTVTAFGTEIQNKKPFEIATLGLVRTFQIVRPFPTMTCRENILVARLLSTPRPSVKDPLIDELLESIGIAHLALKKAQELTLMEKKKMEIARALATTPKLLLLDEVMSGLNPTEINEAIELLLKLRKEKNITIIWIEHVMKAIVKTADRIAVLHRGQLLTVDTPSKVISDPQVIEVYLGRANHA